MNLSVKSLIYFLKSSCRICTVAVFVWLLSIPVSGQELLPDSTSSVSDNASIAPAIAPQADSLPDLKIPVMADTSLHADSVQNDTLSKADKELKWGIKISDEALSSTVTTHATDSAVLDVKQNVFFLYGAAKATYENLEITSGKLIFYQKDNLLTAQPLLDSSGKIVSEQSFKQDSENFTFDTLKYNFKSKRALVRNARTQYGEGFIISSQAKKNADESISFYKSIYTTCNLPHPHFGIRAQKLKVVPGKVIASGPANLEIEDVPTPLYLPFGMFPINESQRSGFILPSYTMEERRGLGLQRGGYYFAISDYLGLISQVDIFSRGSWAVFSTAQYANRYRYNGQLAVNYSYSKIGEVYETNSYTSKDFQVSWTHTMDGRARPGTNFSASVLFGTSDYNALNTTTTANVLNNQYSSSISYAKSWVGKPYSFTAALRHNQSTQTGQVTVRLPELNFNLGQFSPFQRKVMTGSPRWYEKISASYSVSAINEIKFYDSLFSFNSLTFSDFDNGIRHNASVQANYNIFRYLNWNISVPYTEYWNTKQTFLQYSAQKEGIDTTVRTGFFTSRDFNMSTTLSTRIYGMKLFKKGKVAGIRHVLTPNVSATYRPGFAHDPYNYMYSSVQQPGYSPVYRSPYEYTPVGGPGNPNNSGTLSFSMQNTLQMKVRTNDSVGTKKVNLIDGLGLNGSYDLFADSFNMSNITMNFFTSILDIVRVSANASFDPYKYEGTYKTPQYLINTDGKAANFVNGGMSIGIVLAGARQSTAAQDSTIANNSEVKRLLQNDGYHDYYDFNIPWNINVNAGISASRRRRVDRPDTLVYTPNFTFNGGFNLTERWKVNVTSGLTFNTIKDIEPGYTTIDIVRDLHCWQMSLNLVPFGAYRSFHFTLQVKSAMLQDLKLVRRRAYQDNL